MDPWEIAWSAISAHSSIGPKTQRPAAAHRIHATEPQPPLRSDMSAWNGPEFTTEDQTLVGVLGLTMASRRFGVELELQMTEYNGRTHWEWVLTGGWHWLARVMKA